MFKEIFACEEKCFNGLGNAYKFTMSWSVDIIMVWPGVEGRLIFYPVYVQFLLDCT